MPNVFGSLPEDSGPEEFLEILRSGAVRIERIVSRGHASPAQGWYDQEENEWVIVLQGSGTILFETGNEVTLNAGDYINIPGGSRHKVVRTDPDRTTVWLAVFYP